MCAYEIFIRDMFAELGGGDEGAAFCVVCGRVVRAAIGVFGVAVALARGAGERRRGPDAYCAGLLLRPEPQRPPDRASYGQGERERGRAYRAGPHAVFCAPPERPHPGAIPGAAGLSLYLGPREGVAAAKASASAALTCPFNPRRLQTG